MGLGSPLELEQRGLHKAKPRSSLLLRQAAFCTECPQEPPPCLRLWGKGAVSRVRRQFQELKPRICSIHGNRV